MNREEIEKLIEETARKERSKKGVSVEKVRSILNVIFLLCAVVGLILYFAWPDRHGRYRCRHGLQNHRILFAFLVLTV